jgi:hypothetical protein
MSENNQELLGDLNDAEKFAMGQPKQVRLFDKVKDFILGKPKLNNINSELQTPLDKFKDEPTP